MNSHRVLPISLSIVLLLLSINSRPLFGEIDKVEEIAPDVYFHEGDLAGKGHCNNGWVVFDNFVLVIDGNFPSGVSELIPKIQAVTDKPIRFAFDTHHHGDHAYGNQIWADHGAVPIAHVGVMAELKKYETGYFGGTPGRWEGEAKIRPDVAATQLKPPTLLFRKDMIFDDGKHRVELVHFGVAHTHGDGFAWLPKERILFTGDACVNGPYNYMGDGHSGEWIQTLEAAKKLDIKIICPGHGAMGGPEMLADQQTYFAELRKQVKKIANLSADAVKGLIPDIRNRLKKNDRIARYIGDFFPAQVEKVYVELGGQPFIAENAADQHFQRNGKPMPLDRKEPLELVEK